MDEIHYPKAQAEVGANLGDVMHATVEQANQHRQSVRLEFNGFVAVVRPGEDPVALVARFRRDHPKAGNVQL